jgi:hypothetical protein
MNLNRRKVRLKSNFTFNTNPNIDYIQKKIYGLKTQEFSFEFPLNPLNGFTVISYAGDNVVHFYSVIGLTKKSVDLCPEIFEYIDEFECALVLITHEINYLKKMI